MLSFSSSSRLPILVFLTLILLLVILLVIALTGAKTTGVAVSASPSPSIDEQDATPTSILEDSLTPLPALIDNTLTPTLDPPINSICAQAWDIEVMQPLPGWLTTPADAAGLHTEVKYAFLAGELIFHGAVNTSGCVDGGLMLGGAASICGMEKAFPQVVNWQNQFNQDILLAAQNNQVPARLIKRIFAQETQFWPPNKLAPATYGIGNVTSPGIEPLFLWYEDIYQDACRAVFSSSCSGPYHALPLADQQVLRGYFISRYLHPYCPTCPYMLDLEKTGASIDYFAKLIVANCHQVGLVLSNHGFSTSSLSYEDAWRLTIANYTIGAGCVINAIDRMELSRGFSWEYFTENLVPDCSVDIYVNRITGE